MSGRHTTWLTPRGKGRVFIVFCYMMSLFLILGALWLFLSNADQLFPAEEVVQTQGMDTWRTDVRTGIFAGGLWRDASFWRSVNLTITMSAITVCIAALFGIPAAYALSRFRIPCRRLIDVLFSSIIVLPASAIGLCLIVTFQYGPLDRMQEMIGHRFMYSIFPGIVMAQLPLSLAMGLSAWRAAFDSVNPRFEHVARSLGSSRWRAFWTVTLPAAKPGIVTGLILAWTRAMAEFGAVLLFCATFRNLPLSRFGPLTRALHLHQADFLSLAMWSEIEFGNLEYGFGIAFALVLIGAVSVYAIHKTGGRGYVW